MNLYQSSVPFLIWRFLHSWNVVRVSVVAFPLVEDGFPLHISIYSHQLTLSYHIVNSDWPAYSADLNLIEIFAWVRKDNVKYSFRLIVNCSKNSSGEFRQGKKRGLQPSRARSTNWLTTYRLELLSLDDDIEGIMDGEHCVQCFYYRFLFIG